MDEFGTSDNGAGAGLTPFTPDELLNSEILAGVANFDVDPGNELGEETIDGDILIFEATGDIDINSTFDIDAATGAIGVSIVLRADNDINVNEDLTASAGGSSAARKGWANRATQRLTARRATGPFSLWGVRPFRPSTVGEVPSTDLFWLGWRARVCRSGRRQAGPRSSAG